MTLTPSSLRHGLLPVALRTQLAGRRFIFPVNQLPGPQQDQIHLGSFAGLANPDGLALFSQILVMTHNPPNNPLNWP